MTDIDKLYEKGEYYVIVGQLFMPKDEAPRRGYHVVNANTGVVEHEDVVLPNAIDWCNALNKQLLKIRDGVEIDTETAKKSLQLIQH